MSEVLVSIIMLTYNHQENIREAIESVLNQEANFEYELIISNDCSPDQTDHIVRDILSTNDNRKRVKYFRSEKNKGGSANFLFAYEQAIGKYLAICEGDDYWNDPYKLQKQVDFLETNPDYGLVHGDVNILNQESGRIIKAYNKTNKINIPSGSIFETLMQPSHSIKTMTTCFRKDLFEKYYLPNKEIMQSDWALIDISIWLMLAYHSKIHYFDEVLATYRLLPESASRTKNPKKLYQFHQKIHAIKQYYAINYNCPEETRVMLKANKYKSILTDAYAMNDVKLAEIAMNQLKSMNLRISIKQKVMYLGIKHQFIKQIIDFVK